MSLGSGCPIAPRPSPRVANRANVVSIGRVYQVAIRLPESIILFCLAAIKTSLFFYLFFFLFFSLFVAPSQVNQAMKLTNLLPLAALTTAFVIPDEQVMNQVAIEKHETSSDKVPLKDQVHNCLEDVFSNGLRASKNAFDEAFDQASEAGDKIAGKFDDAAANTKAWLESASTMFRDHHGHHSHHGHHGKPNLTVYQLIAESKYTTKFAKLINEYPDLVKALNGTAANYTVFAPTDHAFDKIPEHVPKPSKEDLKKVLEYHLSAEFYPAGRVLVHSNFISLSSNYRYVMDIRILLTQLNRSPIPYPHC